MASHHFRSSLPILALLAFASTGRILGLECDFDLAQSADKLHTRIRVGQQEAIINYVYRSRWIGIVKNATGVVVSDADGKSNARRFNMMDEEQLDAYQNLLQGIELDGTSISSTEPASSTGSGQPGKFLVESVEPDGSLSSSGNGFGSFAHLSAGFTADEVNKLSRGVLEIETPGRVRFLNDHLFAVLNGQDFWGFNHVVFLLPSSATSPVVLVDNQCQRIRILTQGSLKANLKGY